MLIRFAIAAAVFGPLAVGASSAAVADCEAAVRDTTYVAAQGDIAFRSENYIEGSNAVSIARFPSIDAANEAKACGCPEAVPPLQDATVTTDRANRAFDLSNVRIYGARLKKSAEEALGALRRCAGR